jgi:hypothetical protein
LPTNRRRSLRGRQSDITEGARWWLEFGRPLGIAEAEALGCFEDPDRAAWDASNLHFVRPGRGVTRARLRELGYSQAIEHNIALGAPPDEWRRA